EVARAVLVHAFDQALRLLHPIVPFVTEALWQRLPGRRGGEFLATAHWPACRRDAESAGGRDFELVRQAVLAVRQIRGDNAVPPGKTVDAHIVANGHPVFAREAATIGRLARATVHVAG